MSVRLPLWAPSGPSQVDAPAPLDLPAASARFATHERVIAIASVQPSAELDAFASAVVTAAVARHARVLGVLASGNGSLGSAVLRERGIARAMRDAGAEDVRQIAMGTDAARREARAVLAARQDGLLVAIGAEVPAYYQARAAVLLTFGLPVSSWDPLARALRDRVDVVLTDARPRYAALLAESVC